MISINRAFLGDDICQWFDSLFTKPARVGESTPWHQDIGLWVKNKALHERKAFVREALSIWMALTPSTVENGGIASVTLRDEEARVVFPNLRPLVKGGKTVSFDEVKGFKDQVW